MRFSSVTVLILAAGLVVITGCKPKDDSSGTTATSNAATGSAGTAQKPTPEQEAAKQRAIDQGPAIEASLKAQQGH